MVKINKIFVLFCWSKIELCFRHCWLQCHSRKWIFKRGQFPNIFWENGKTDIKFFWLGLYHYILGCRHQLWLGQYSLHVHNPLPWDVLLHVLCKGRCWWRRQLQVRVRSISMESSVIEIILSCLGCLWWRMGRKLSLWEEPWIRAWRTLEHLHPTVFSWILQRWLIV